MWLLCLSTASCRLEGRDKPILFSMARLDRVKNLTGLVEWFAKTERLRHLCHLVVVGGNLDEKLSKDREEIDQIRQMHSLIKEYKLEGQFRWICSQKDRVQNGEVYRYIADTGGAFVQVRRSVGYGGSGIEGA